MFQNNVLFHKRVSLRAEGVAIPEVGYSWRLLRRTHRGCHCEPKAWQSQRWGYSWRLLRRRLFAMLRASAPRNDNGKGYDNGKGCLLKLTKNPFFFKEEGVQNNFPAKCLWVKINKLFPFNLSLFALTFRGEVIRICLEFRN